MLHINNIRKFLNTKSTRFLLFFFLSQLIACSGGDGDSSTSGNGFNMSGKVTNSSSNLSGVTQGVTVSANYVYAVNIGSRVYLDRKKVPIEQDGSFSIELTKGDSWILAFIDSSQVGFDMVKGIFKADQLDSIAPKQSASSSGTNVGELTVDEFGDAKLPPERYVTYIGDLGMTFTEAAEFAAMDDFSLRYMNPDIDANGLIDIDEQNGIEFALTSWQDYLYDYGNEDALLSSYVRNGLDLPYDKVVTYRGGSGPKLSINQMESGVFSGVPGKWSLAWTDSGNYTGGSSVVWTTNITGTIWTETSDGYTGYSVMFPNTVTNIPDGSYTYQFFENAGDTLPIETLTLLPVKTMDDVTNVTNYIFPFPVLNVDANDNIISVSYKMMKWEAGSFVPATSTEIELYIGAGEIQIGWGSATGNKSVNFSSKNLSYATSGTIDLVNPPEPWVVTVQSSGDPVKRSDITGLEMSFVSRHGIWVALNINPMYQINN